MKRDQVLKRLAQSITDEIVVAVYQTCFDWLAICPRDLNYVAVGAMGQASSHGLGLALARPDKRVIVLDGDGSLLMNLGSLVTISEAAPKNLHHLVFVNGVYEVNGEHPVPGAGRVDFAAMANAAGYRNTTTFDEMDDFETRIAAFLRSTGPSFAAVHVTAGEPYPRDYDYIHSSEARDRFRRALSQR